MRTFVEGSKLLFLLMKGGGRGRISCARVTDHEALAGLLATVAVSMQCSVRACAGSVHKSVKHVVLVPQAFGAVCALLTRRG